MFDRLDALINIDYNKRSIDHLYRSAKSLQKEALTERAVRLISSIEEESYVFFTTGSVTRSWVTPKIGETDGPPGTAVLAKKIREYKNIIPIILTEESLVETTIPVLKAAGLIVVTPEEALNANKYKEKGYTSVACIIPFPSDEDLALQKSNELIKEFNPAAIFSIEKAGKTSKGTYHNMRGHDYSQGRARVDTLINRANEEGIITIAIGDGGNEIGMGNVKEAVEKYVPHGEKLACVTKTDLLLTASVSNWGCYAICAALALHAKDKSLLPEVEMERRVLEAAVSSGHVDGATGKADITVDGFSLETNEAIISLLRAIALKGL